MSEAEKPKSAFHPVVSRRAADIPPAPMPRGDGAQYDPKTLIVGREITLSGEITACERLLVEGKVEVAGLQATPGMLAYLGSGRDECALAVHEPATALLLGGVPFPEPIVMWWNFVGRTRDELGEARRQWTEDDGRFGVVASGLPRIGVSRPPWE